MAKRERPLSKRHLAVLEKAKERARPNLKPGDKATCSPRFSPLFYTVPNPCKVLRVEESSRFMSGYAVTIETSAGPETIDSNYLTKAEADVPA